MNAAGGETVTFTFDDLYGDSAATAWIANAGNACATTVSGNDIECVTVEHTAEHCSFDIGINIAGQGRPWHANVELYYGYVYSDPMAWGNTFGPQEGEMIYIPPCKAVLLDQSTPVLSAILVEGKLIVKDLGEGNLIEIHSTYIMIHKGGLFQAGTKTNRYLGDLVITMYGTI